MSEKLSIEAKGAASSAVAVAAEYALSAAEYTAALSTAAALSAAAAGNAGNAAKAAAKAAGYADAYANELPLPSADVIDNANYKKVITKYNNDPANLKAAFITAAGLIYQSVYEIIKKK
jgi:hypothetical protein